MRCAACLTRVDTCNRRFPPNTHNYLLTLHTLRCMPDTCNYLPTLRSLRLMPDTWGERVTLEAANT
jgi:hypothetical protein